MPDRVRVMQPLAIEVPADELPDLLALGELIRARLTEATAVLDSYGHPDHDPRVVAVRDQLAALDDVDQADAPAPARTRKARP